MAEAPRRLEDEDRDDDGDGTFKRTFAIRADAIDEATRTASVSFSSQDPVRDSFWGPPRALLHERKAVDLSVMRAMGAALINHDPNQIVGRAVQLEIDEDERKGRAAIVFDDDDDGTRAFNKVKSGSLRGVSVRFSVERSQILEERTEWTSPGGQTFRGGDAGLEVATRWTPREISLTPIPADTSVGVGRGAAPKEETPMFSEKTLERLKARGLQAEAFSSEAAAVATLDSLDAQDALRTQQTPPETPPEAPQRTDDNDSSRAEVESHKKRTAALLDLAERAGLGTSKVNEWLNADTSLEAASREVIDHLSKSNPPVAGPPLERGHDAIDKVRHCIEGAICTRGKIPYTRPEGFQEEIPAYMRYEDMARAWLRANNVRADNLTPEQVIERAWFTRATAAASGDFPKLLANVANKSMQVGFMEAPVTYPAWTVSGTIPDFRQADRPNVGEIQDFELTPDGMPFPESAISEKREQLTLKTYSRKFGIGRQALMNDDQRGLTEWPRRFGQAGNRTINIAVYDHITQASGVGPTMNEDSKALFATDHPSGANYITGAGTTLQDSQVAVGRANMMKQLAITASQRKSDTTISNARINIAPTYLLVPAALAHTADQLVNGSFVPTTVATAQTAWVRSLIPIAEAYLDGKTNGATAWYLAASPTAISTVEVARLAGQTGPGFRSWELQDGLGFFWAGWVDFAVQALEHRGLFRSKGAA